METGKLLTETEREAKEKEEDKYKNLKSDKLIYFVDFNIKFIFFLLKI